MEPVKSGFRHWWQPPRRLADRESERSVSFLELFYDLIYVVIVAELAHALALNLSWAGIGQFAFLFVIVWWAWLNGSIYHDLHGNNDIRTRVFTFLQMGTVAAMAVFAHNAMGAGGVGFAFSHAAFQAILLYLWWRTGVHDPDHRPLSNRYSAGYLLSTLMFITSAFLAAPARHTLWILAAVITLLMPLYLGNLGRHIPSVQAQIELSAEMSPSLLERFGLLTIIVLGEVLVATVQGIASHHELTLDVALTAALGILIAVGIWWLYFDAIAQRQPRTGRQVSMAWMFLHLPLTMGIVAMGAALLNVVENSGLSVPPPARWLLAGGCSLVLLSIVLLMGITQSPAEQLAPFQRVRWVALAAMLLLLPLALISLGPIPLLLGILSLLLAPMLAGVWLWIETLAPAE